MAGTVPADSDDACGTACDAASANWATAGTTTSCTAGTTTSEAIPYVTRWITSAIKPAAACATTKE